jgi:acetoacetyl-CoA synthetase
MQPTIAPTVQNVCWNPSLQRDHAVYRFADVAEQRFGMKLPDFAALYDWSVAKPEDFWRLAFEFLEIQNATAPGAVLEGSQAMPSARWFPNVKLNFAENLLQFTDDRTAIVSYGETQIRRTLSYRQLYDEVAQVAVGLRAFGVEARDRVVGIMPNMPETIIAMLATTSLGAIWSSCSPDFGVAGVLDRFGQITPKVLFAADGYFFKERPIDILNKVRKISQAIPSLERTVIVPYISKKLSKEPSLDGFRGGMWYNEFASNAVAAIDFVHSPFNHPLYIMFSSGTTGKPKCIIHSAGGTLLEHKKELILHTDLTRNDVLFYQTTCSWMMWNWLVSGLSVGATIVLYDGSPLVNRGEVLFDIAQKEGITVFGTNAKFLAVIEQEGVCPCAFHPLSKLRTILSTGSPLLPTSFDYISREFGPDVQLSSISGGTDILGCFALGSPAVPVYRGELQCRSLGLTVQVFDSNGHPVIGEKGDLVCTAPFPSMPIGFWNDPTGSRYRSAYFERFPGVWYHGDYVLLTERGSMVFFGRSDAVLNPGGIRIGTAEIYNQVERIPEVAEGLVVCQCWQGDERIVLFVKLRPGATLDDMLRERIRREIRSRTTAFHVPKKIIEVPDIPCTRSGKIIEIAVRRTIHGEFVDNVEAIANPEALEYFKNLPELKTD